MSVFWIVLLPVFFGAGFWFFYNRNKMSLIPSYFLTLFLLSSAAIIMSYLYTYLIDSGNFALRILFALILLPLALVMTFGVYGLIFILLTNAYIILKRERRSFAHALTLILALCIIGFSLFTHFYQNVEVPDSIQIFFYVGYFLVAFYFIHIIHYTIANILANLSCPKYNQQYIIVHGSGLINGKVPPLLASRVDKAIEFYNKQKKVSYAPKLILSGGKGNDETISEAQAMMEYASLKGIPEEDILLEDKSETTMQNMKFSKEIMDNITTADEKPYRCIFSTSNYHLLRTGIYARVAGLKIDGIGSKTALYYLPNALIREYIAYVVMHKRRHMVFVLICFLCAFAISMILTISSCS